MSGRPARCRTMCCGSASRRSMSSGPAGCWSVRGGSASRWSMRSGPAGRWPMRLHGRPVRGRPTPAIVHVGGPAGRRPVRLHGTPGRWPMSGGPAAASIHVSSPASRWPVGCGSAGSWLCTIIRTAAGGWSMGGGAASRRSMRSSSTCCRSVSSSPTGRWSVRGSSAGRWPMRLHGGTTCRRSVSSSPTGRRPMRGHHVCAASRWSVCEPAAGRSMRSSTASRPMRGAAAGWVRCWGGRLVSSSCLAHGAEHQETGKNHYRRSFAKNTAKKLCLHRILFSLALFWVGIPSMKHHPALQTMRHKPGLDQRPRKLSTEHC
jgi:hypothetical protein